MDFDEDILEENSAKCDNGRINFNGFSFPVISSLVYSLDGPNRTRPDRLFVSDGNDEFVASFEEGYCEFPYFYENDYREYRYSDGAIFIRFFYPAETRPDLTMGYFSIEFLKYREIKKCIGQLNIRKTEISYCEKLKKMKKFHEFMYGIVPEKC